MVRVTSFPFSSLWLLVYYCSEAGNIIAVHTARLYIVALTAASLRLRFDSLVFGTITTFGWIIFPGSLITCCNPNKYSVKKNGISDCL